MPDTVTQILFGAHATLKLAPWITAKSPSGSLVEVGSTDSGVSIDWKPSFHEQYIDRALGPAKVWKIKGEAEVKFTLTEATIDNMVTAFGQPVGNKSGTTPNFTLLLSLAAQTQVLQMELKGPGLGSGLTRTVIGWSTWVKALGPVQMKKDLPQQFQITLGVMQETTGTGVDDIKVVES